MMATEKGNIFPGYLPEKQLAEVKRWQMRKLKINTDAAFNG